MKLSHRDLGGEGPPLVILHGLLGSSRNWLAAGKDLSRAFRVLAPDLRNHGESPHDTRHDFDSLARDFVAWLDENELSEVYLIGHSMGGKTAMKIACDHPDRVRALVVVDISPAEKVPTYRREIAALARLPLEKISSRKDADRLLGEEVKDRAVRQFLLTNLVRDGKGGWRWQANLEGLVDNLDETGKKPIGEDDRYEKPALFVLGEKSNFVRPEDHPVIQHHFPRARIETVPGAGHNPHVETRETFVQIVKQFLPG